MKGVSEVLSLVIITLVTVVGIAAVSFLGQPTLDATRDAALLNEAQRNMQIFDNMVRQAAAEGDGVVKKSTITVTDGVYRTDAQSNSLWYEAGPRSDKIPSTYMSDNKIVLNSTYTDINIDGTFRIGAGRHEVCVEKLQSGDDQVHVNVTSC